MQNMEHIYEEDFQTVYKYLLCLTHNKEISEDLTRGDVLSSCTKN